MKNINHDFFALLIIAFGLLSIGLFIFITLMMGLETNSPFTIYISIAMLLFFIISGVLVYITSPNRIKDEVIKIERLENGNFQIDYKDYHINTQIRNNEINNIINNIDENMKKINYVDKKRINNYLYNNYDSICLPTSIEQITEKDIINSFNMIQLSPENKKAYLNNSFKNTLLSMLLGVVISIPVYLFGPEDLKFIIIIALIIGIIRLIYISIKTKNKQTNSIIYKAQVYIYDRKKEYDNSSESTTYSIKVCNDKKQVLNKWFNVKKQFYDNVQTPILYCTVTNNKYEFELKEEDQ